MAAGRRRTLMASPTLAHFERRQSRATGVYETLDWPVDEWRAPFTGQLNAFQSELISDRAPSFARFDLGVANLLGLNLRTGWSLPSPELVVRQQDMARRITAARASRRPRLKSHSTARIGGAILELAGDAPGQTHRIHKPEALRPSTFPTPSGLPFGAVARPHEERRLAR